MVDLSGRVALVTGAASGLGSSMEAWTCRVVRPERGQ